MDDQTGKEGLQAPPDIKIYLRLFGVFYFFFLLLTPLGTDISFVTPGLEPRGIYHVLKIDGGDDAGYFAYLRSLFIDRDIDFFNEPYYIAHNRVTDTGYVFNQWNIGPAVLWLPFFVGAHFITKIYNLLGVPLAQDGLSFVYFSSTALGSATYVYFGLILHFLILRRWFSKQAAFWCVTLFFLATPLVYFTFIRSRMAHADDYFLSCLFIFCWLSFRPAPSAVKSILLGLCGGLLVLTRINSACLLLLPLYDFFARAYLQFREKEEKDFGRLLHYLWVPVFCALVYSLQVGVNFILSGEIAGDARWSRVSILFLPHNWMRLFTNPADILWGSNWGLLWHAPIYIIGACGLYFFIKRNKDVGRPLLVALSIPVFLALLWPHHGLSYGYRHLLTTNIILSFGAALLFDAIKSPKKPWFLTLISLVLIAWSYVQLCFFKIVIPYDSTQFILQTVKSLFILFKIPEFLLRGGNFFYMFFHPHFEIKTYLDQYLLVLFPLLQLCIPLILLFTGIYIWDKMNRHPEARTLIIKPAIILATLFFVGLNVMIQIQSDDRPPEFIAKRKAEAAARTGIGGQAPGIENEGK